MSQPGDSIGPMSTTVVDQDYADDLTAEEVRGLLDEQARRYLGMTGEEFVAAAEQGSLPDHPAVAHLVLLAGAGAC